MSLQERAADTAHSASEIAAKASYSSAISTLIAGLTLNDVAIIIGIVATVLTTAANIYYKRKQYKLEVDRARFQGVRVEE